VGCPSQPHAHLSPAIFFVPVFPGGFCGPPFGAVEWHGLPNLGAAAFPFHVVLQVRMLGFFYRAGIVEEKHLPKIVE
jgi:hypothetical protein